MSHLNEVFIRLAQELVSINNSVMKECAPVPYFGDVESSRIATLGLNPSDNEFYDKHGNELKGDARRFNTLSSLSITSWHDLSDCDVDRVKKSCDFYFERSPYKTWFDVLDKLVFDSGYSYYEDVFSKKMCHLDLVPYATREKWGRINSIDKRDLLDRGGNFLYEVLSVSNISCLILNGKSVIEEFSKVSNVDYRKNYIEEWDLKRTKGNNVKGYSYFGEFNVVNGFDLGRRVLVLGFNHNLQSSFGVTNEVKNNIASWIKRNLNEKV